MAAIYQITNKYNNRKYIGKSSNVFKRLGKHMSELINNNHINKFLQKDFNKYGYNGFTFEILEICTVDEMELLEKQYISNLDSNNDYNIVGLNQYNLNLKANINDNKSKERKGNYNFDNLEMDIKKIKEYIVKNKLVSRRLPSSEISNVLNLGKSTFDRRIKPELEKRKIIKKVNSMSYIIQKF